MTLSETSQTSFRPMRQIRRTRDLYRFLFRKLYLPVALVDAIVRGIRFAANPSQGRLRQGAVRRASQVKDTESKHLRERGYLTFEASRFPGTKAAMADCRRVFAEAQAELEARGNQKKNFLVTVRKDADFAVWPNVFSFASSRELIDLAAVYLERVPVLSSVSLWWSPPNDSAVQSQMFHCDREDTSVLKMFFNVEEVTAAHGPFCMLPADVSDQIKDSLDYRHLKSSRVSDEDIAAHSGFDHLVTFEGPRNTGACVDTSRCLHYGSRGNSKSRLVLMLRYSDYLAPYTDIPDWYGALRGTDYALDDIQRLALGLRT